MKRTTTALGLLTWALWLSCEYLAFGAASYTRQHDAAEVNTAYYTAIPLLEARGLRGRWDPLAGSGVDALSNLKGDMPLVEAVFRRWPSWYAAGLLLFGQTAVAGLGAYAFLRRRMRVGPGPALICSAWFAFLPWSSIPYSGFPTWYGWYVPAFPLVLLVLFACAGQPGRGTAAVATVTGALLALGTPAASGILVLPAVAACSLAFATGDERRRIPLLLGCFAAAFLVLKAPTVTALFTTVPLSHRVLQGTTGLSGANGGEFWTGRFGELRAVLKAHSVLILASVSGWFVIGRRDPRLNVALLGILLLLALTFAAPLLQPVMGLVGASFRSYQVDRLNRFLPFLLAIAAALSLEHLRSARGPVLRGIRTGVWAGLVVALVAATLWMNAGREARRIAGSRFDAFFSQPILRRIAAERWAGEPFRVATFADRNAGEYGQHAAFAWAYGLETADMYVTTYPLRYHEFWSQVIAPVREARTDLRHYFDTWGSMAYLFNPAAPLFEPLPDSAPRALRALPFNLDLLSLANVRYLISAVPLSDPRLRLRPDSRGLLVYENAGYLPRFFVAHEVRTFPRDEDVLAALASATREDLRWTVFASVQSVAALALPGTAPEGARAEAKVRIERYAADAIDLVVENPFPGVLVIANSYNPNWTARVGGAPTPVFAVDHTFQGIIVKEGIYRVSLVYDPPHAFGGSAQPLILGFAVALVGAAGTLIEKRVAS